MPKKNAINHSFLPTFPLLYPKSFISAKITVWQSVFSSRIFGATLSVRTGGAKSARAG